MSELTKWRLRRILSFGIAGAIWMLLTLVVPHTWSPVTSRFVDWGQRLFFFSWGLWCGIPKGRFQ